MCTLVKCAHQEHATVIWVVCQHRQHFDTTLVSKGAHGHRGVCGCTRVCVCAYVLPVRLLTVSSSVFLLGSDFKSAPKANGG